MKIGPHTVTKIIVVRRQGHQDVISFSLEKANYVISGDSIALDLKTPYGLAEMVLKACFHVQQDDPRLEIIDVAALRLTN